MNQIDTITAIATPLGRSGVGVLRVSGPMASTVANTLLGKIPRARQAEYLPFHSGDGTILDHGIALFFPGPHSFTGEDVLEFQGHGNPVILELLLQHIVSLPGVRIARPGEFSERAFLNEKMDLTQAEAIADLINASSEQAARSAINSLQGVFSKRIYELVEELTNLRIYIESVIDFPNEEIDFLSNDRIETNLNNVISCLNAVRIEARQGILLREGMKVVIAGKPNVGKSSILNALAGCDVAIVSAIEGTTRDVLREHIHLDGMPLHIIDTAGLRETGDEVERIGIERAWHEIERADHVLLIVDSATTPLSDQDMIWPEFISRLPPGIPVTVVRNKADLTGESIAISDINNYPIITISTQSSVGINLLRNYLKKSIGFIGSTIDGGFLARQRHLDALEIADAHLQQGKEKLAYAYASELLAEELRLAQQALSEITGEISSDDLLSKIFSSFCIGK